MSDTLANARFFMDSETHAWLYNRFDSIEEKSFFDSCSFGYDVTDQPFYCAVSSQEGDVHIKIYVRSEMGAFLESPDIGVKFPAEGEGLEVTANTGRLGGNAGEVVAVFYKAAIMLGMQLKEKGLVDGYQNMNTDAEGVIVSLHDGELDFDRVQGKKRPNMACTTLFGGVQMSRPYQDEIMDGWMDELLPLEEKIAMAEDGDEDMMEQLAMMYLNGDGEVETDPEKAVYWLTKLAELDNSNAQFNMGLHCAKGFGIPRDFEKAVYWLEKAAENGDEDAPGLIEKLKKAVAAEKIVDSGDAQAQADLAEVYMFIGNSLSQADPDADYAIALDYAQKSAAQNNGNGLWALALAYEHGRGVAQDVQKAIDCYRKGAELGHAPSEHSLACYYFRGDVLEEDHEKAFALCMKSAQQGYGLAMRDVGRAYQFGNGVEENMSLAIEWYEKSLAVTYDPELERKVGVFKMLEEGGAFADEGDGDDIDDWDMPDGMLEAMELQEFVEGAGYQNSCDEKGVFTVGDEKMIAFATELANAGNEEAQLVLARYFLANESTEAQKAQAIAWVTEMAENGDVAAQMILEDLD